MSNTPSPKAAPSRVAAALLGGLVAGTIDIGSASLINWRGPAVIGRAIASGLLGPASFKEGAYSAGLGFTLQWAMSVAIALLYSLAVDRIAGLRERWVAGGLVAGAVTFFVMNYVVLRLSAVGRSPNFTAATFAENLVAILAFGLIIAFFARKSNAREA